MTPMPDSPENLVLSDVYLLTDARDGRVAIPHLKLEMDADGIRLTKENGDPAWHCEWPLLGELSTAERSVLPEGREGVVLVVAETGGRRHRFVLPTSQPASLEFHLREVAVAHGLSTRLPPRAVSPVLTVVVVVAAVVTLTMLLLSAAHVIHF